MTAFVIICAIVMFIVIFYYMKDFVTRINRNTSSVGGNKVNSCEVLRGRSVVRTFESPAPHRSFSYILADRSNFTD